MIEKFSIESLGSCLVTAMISPRLSCVVALIHIQQHSVGKDVWFSGVTIIKESSNRLSALEIL